MGTKVSEFMSIGPMVIDVDIQCHNPRPFDYASHISRGIDLGIRAIMNGSPTIHFKKLFPSHAHDIVLWTRVMNMARGIKNHTV